MSEPIRLHLGCGAVRIPGFTGIDVRPSPAVDREEDIGTLPSFKPGTVSLIYASHCLDHFSRHRYMDVLKRWRELLVSNGILRLSCVDFRAVAELYWSGVPVSELLGLLHARQDYPSNVRKVSWDYESLESDLFNAGFSQVRLWDWRDTDHADIDDCSQAYWPKGDRAGKLVSLNVEGIA